MNICMSHALLSSFTCQWIRWLFHILAIVNITSMSMTAQISPRGADCISFELPRTRIARVPLASVFYILANSVQGFSFFHIIGSGYRFFVCLFVCFI